MIGSAQPVLGRHGSSRMLGGLPEDSALALVAGDLGRPLTAEELAAARRLVSAVEGQPLHLRQGAALAREGRHSLRSLARQAVHDPEVLDRLSINVLAQHERRALAVLALAAGTLLPATVVEAIGQIAYMAEWLESLRRRGLAEQCDDRFGLPVCKAESYRQMLFKDLELAASARALSSWLTAADPTAAESQSAAEAALSMMGFAAERGDWATVVRLARAAERVLFVAGRWEAWHRALSHGLYAARASGDRAAEALFAHQQGTLAFCQDQLDDAYQLLQQALTLRMQIGDNDGASITRHNLRLLKLPDAPPPPRSSMPRRALHTLGGVAATLALVVSTVAITGVMRSGGSADGKPTGPPSTSATHANGSSSASGQPSSSSQSQSHGHSSGPGSGKRPLQFTPATLPAATVGLADSQQITASGGTPPYAFSWSGTLPPGLSLSANGAISGTPTTPGSYQFTVKASDTSTPAGTGSRAYTLRVAPGTVTIALSPGTLPPAMAGVADSQQITASGGTPPYAFSWSGTLPPGLSLSANGAISGTPTTPGSYQFTVKASDTSTPAGTGSRAYTLRVAPGTVTIALSPGTLPPAMAGVADSQQITASGGTPPYAFSWSGTLPPGLSLSANGAISGTPTTPGSYQFTITAIDSSAGPNKGSEAYTLQVAPEHRHDRPESHRAIRWLRVHAIPRDDHRLWGHGAVQLLGVFGLATAWAFAVFRRAHYRKPENRDERTKLYVHRPGHRFFGHAHQRLTDLHSQCGERLRELHLLECRGAAPVGGRYRNHWADAGRQNNDLSALDTRSHPSTRGDKYSAGRASFQNCEGLRGDRCENSVASAEP